MTSEGYWDSFDDRVSKTLTRYYYELNLVIWNTDYNIHTLAAFPGLHQSNCHIAKDEASSTGKRH